MFVKGFIGDRGGNSHGKSCDPVLVVYQNGIKQESQVHGRDVLFIFGACLIEWDYAVGAAAIPAFDERLSLCDVEAPIAKDDRKKSEDMVFRLQRTETSISWCDFFPVP